VVHSEGGLPHDTGFPADARFEKEVSLFGPVPHHLGSLDVRHARSLRCCMVEKAFKRERIGRYAAERAEHALVVAQTCS
jgi:hypothetical protein